MLQYCMFISQLNYNKFGKMNNPAKGTKKVNYRLHYFNKEPFCLFLHYIEGHPVNIKQKFPIGFIKVFDDTRMFYRQLFSTQHLNQNVQWGHKYFNVLVQSFHKFQILQREDTADQALDLIVKGKLQGEQLQVLLHVVLEASFGGDMQKQFWKQFENYNEFKNHQIQDYEQQSKQNCQTIDRKLKQINNYTQNAQKQKNKLLGRLSALLTQKVNKLKEYEEDYNIQLLQDKFNKANEQKIMSTYQQEAQFHGSLFQPSQNFR